MDSITQITLGAAVGEIVLGRKIGNRAMVWGAIAGTIPDLDIVTNLWMDPIISLSHHRGITHSFFFAFMASLPLAWLIHRLYSGGANNTKGYKYFVSILTLFFTVAVSYGMVMLFKNLPGLWGVMLPSFVVLTAGYLLYRLVKNYLFTDEVISKTSFMDWYWLFSMGFFTHIILDCFTAYGTQIFLPFSNTRVAFDNISVADPLYTVPFLTCLIAAAIISRDSKWRPRLNWAGIVLSSIYMLFTLFNKQRVDRVFSKSLEERNIEVIRQRTSPAIFNNLLWNCVAETEDKYYMGLYSIYDEGQRLHYLNEIPKNHEKLEPFAEDKRVKILKWFSNGYYTVNQKDDHHWVLNDLRFGGTTDTVRIDKDFVFSFEIKKSENRLVLRELREVPENPGQEFSKLWKRMNGKKLANIKDGQNPTSLD